jgi:histone deacetylase 6
MEVEVSPLALHAGDLLQISSSAKSEPVHDTRSLKRDPINYSEDVVLRDTNEGIDLYVTSKLLTDEIFAGGSDSSVPRRSGLIYDIAMRGHWDSRSRSEHPEDPRRILCIYHILCRAGLYDEDEEELDFPDLDRNRSDKLVRIPFKNASFDQLLLVHSDDHILEVQKYSRPPAEADDEFLLWCEMRSVYFSEMAYKCALISCGGAIEACRAVLSGAVKNSLAVIRPPGHHADLEGPKGFCMFNNVGVATRVVQKEFPKSCRKVLVLDWDVHHGNGTQDIFDDDPNVLYISLHVFANGTFYPVGHKGNMDQCGTAEGVGRNVNIPWSRQGMHDGDYIYAFERVVMPIAREFDPDFVIISAGFDAAEGDPLGGCHVSPECYSWMTYMLLSLARGRCSVILEGGYNLLSISKSAMAVARTLMGHPPDQPEITNPSIEGRKVVEKVVEVQSRHWDCMKPSKFVSLDNEDDRE